MPNPPLFPLLIFVLTTSSLIFGQNTIPAFGRRAILGTFYDPTNAQISPLNFLHPEPLPRSLILLKIFDPPIWLSGDTIQRTNTDLIKYFKLAPHVKLDYLCGLMNLSAPSSSFMQQTEEGVAEDIQSMVKGTVIIQKRTMTESLLYQENYREQLRPFIKIAELIHQNHGHFLSLPSFLITNITYGVTIRVKFSRLLAPMENRTDILKDLAHQMCVVSPLCPHSMGLNVGTRDLTGFKYNFQLKIESDSSFIRNDGGENSMNIHQARQFIQENIRLAQPVPIEYGLTSTDSILKTFDLQSEAKAKKFKPIYPQYVNSSLSLLESLDDLRAQCFHLLAEAEEVKNCVSPKIYSQLFTLKAAASGVFAKCQENLRKIIVPVRRLLFPPIGLKAYVRNFRDGKFNELRRAFLMAKRHPVETYKLLARNNVQCIDKRVWADSMTTRRDVDFFNGDDGTTYVLLAGDVEKGNRAFLMKAMKMVQLARREGTKCWVGDFEDCRWNFCDDLPRNRTTIVKFFGRHMVSTNV